MLLAASWQKFLYVSLETLSVGLMHVFTTMDDTVCFMKTRLFLCSGRHKICPLLWWVLNGLLCIKQTFLINNGNKIDHEIK